MNTTTTLSYYVVKTTIADVIKTTIADTFDEPQEPLTSEQARCLVLMALVVLILGSPLSTLVGFTSSILAKKEYSSFINCLIAFYNIAVGKNLSLNFNQSSERLKGKQS